MSNPLAPEALRTVDALVQAVRALPGARPDRIGLFGHSRGGGAVFNYVLNSGDKVQAAVLENTGYPTELAERASQVMTSLLMCMARHPRMTVEARCQMSGWRETLRRPCNESENQ